MKPTTIKNTIDTILNPDFRCSLHHNTTDFLSDYPEYSDISYTPLKMNQRVYGNSDACILQIGNMIDILKLKKTSLLIFDLDHKIMCNKVFTVHKEDSECTDPYFFPDFSFHFLTNSESNEFYYSIPTVPRNGTDYATSITGEAEIEDALYLRSLPIEEILKFCNKLIIMNKLSVASNTTRVAVTIHEVDYQNSKWSIFKY
ncbi:hypothetical protein [Aquimarina longa]|uniref:hypothetical protein n=1 Tax=Aquimarina longa TaxID=1080221 RepID=UPI0011E00185|nr:hypothetical protein [Aquimarina longa]